MYFFDARRILRGKKYQPLVFEKTQFTVPEGGIEAGQYFGFGASSPLAKNWEIVGGVQSAFDISTNGDQAFVYCMDADGIPNFLWGISFNGRPWMSPGLEVDAYGEGGSARPSSLEFLGSVALGRSRNCVYEGDVAGRKSDLQLFFMHPSSYKCSFGFTQSPSGEPTSEPFEVEIPTAVPRSQPTEVEAPSSAPTSEESPVVATDSSSNAPVLAWIGAAVGLVLIVAGIGYICYLRGKLEITRRDSAVAGPQPTVDIPEQGEMSESELVLAEAVVVPQASLFHQTTRSSPPDHCTRRSRNKGRSHPQDLPSHLIYKDQGRDYQQVIGQGRLNYPLGEVENLPSDLDDKDQGRDYPSITGTR